MERDFIRAIWILVSVKTVFGFEIGRTLVFSSMSESLRFAGGRVSKSSIEK